MTIARLKDLLASRMTFAVLAGVLLACAYEKFGVAGFAWVAPGALVAAALGLRGWSAFRIGYFGGLAFNLILLHWLLLIPYRWHGIPFGPALGWLCLSAFLALYPATWVWMICSIAPVHSGDLHNSNAWGALRSLVASRWSARARWGLMGAAAWVGFEMIQARLLSGFPWSILGITQYRMLPLIQCASVAGVYGVSFLLVWTSLCGLCAVGKSVLAGGRSSWAADMILPVMVVAVVFAQGFRTLRLPEGPGRTWRVLLVQPSIPQNLIWESANDDARFAELLALSEQGMTNHPQAVIWPEAAVPKLVRLDEKTLESVTGFAKRHRVWMIIGSDDAEPPERKPGPGDPQAIFRNSSFLVAPDGVLQDRYCKRNLVIFGEYIPLVRWMPFLKWFTPIDGGFTPGDRPVTFHLEDPPLRASVMICFEDVFPHMAREYVARDTDVLVNIANNGWFGESAAQWQHGAAGIFRAVENNIPLVRCGNNGLSCRVDRSGALRQIFRDAGSGSVHGKGTLLIEVPIALSRGEPTFYNRHGDVFGWACVGLTGTQLLAWLAAKRRRNGGVETGGN